MSEWQDISTAPSDVPVLAFTENNQVVAAMKFEGRWCVGGLVAATDGLSHAEFKIFFTPTHWQPLPPPPRDSK